VHIATGDRNEVKVDAIKSASTKERLDEARIEIDAGRDYVSIRTKYRDRDQTWNDDNWHNNPPSVEYTVTVPLGAHLDEIKLINGSLDVAGVSGEVRASCINGKLEAKDLSGRAQLSTINGRLDARFSHLSGSALELNSVNGSVKLTIPSDAKAEIEANTVSGDIENDFGLHVNRHRYVGRDMRGELAGGGARIKLENVNGRIEIRHAEDGRQTHADRRAESCRRGDRHFPADARAARRSRRVFRRIAEFAEYGRRERCNTLINRVSRSWSAKIRF